MHHTTAGQSSFIHAAMALMLFLFALPVLSSCTSRQVEPKRPATVTVPPRADAPWHPSLAQVQEAFRSGNMEEAQKAARLLTAAAEASRSEQAEAWRILALSAANNRHPYDSLEALEKWRAFEPYADAGEEWVKTWSSAVSQLPDPEAERQAKSILGGVPRPKPVLFEANLFLLESELNGRVPGASLLGRFERLYDSVQAVSEKKMLEQRLFKSLHQLDAGQIASLLRAVNGENEKRYPYALVALESIRRQHLDSRARNLTEESMLLLKSNSHLADLSLFSDWIRPDLSMMDGIKVSTHNIALVLPLTGELGNISDRIVRGAQLACQGLEQYGQRITLRVIDVDADDWLNQVASLPGEVQVVGGTMRRQDYTKLKNSQQISSRIFFCFLRHLDDGDEGTLAWRFFANDEDQISALLDFASRLEVARYGVLMPDDAYAERMFTLFSDQIKKSGLSIARTQTYPSKDYTQWNNLASSFLETDKKATAAPHTPFRALFLPDSWRNASLMVPNLFYYRENRLLLMGPSLWEQELNTSKHIDTRYYGLTIFPGAWDPASAAQAGLALRAAAASDGQEQADFWMSLGFDFVNMASSLSLGSAPEPWEVNMALNRLKDVLWSGAPIFWDEHGFARRKLFVFTPAETGFVIADPEKISRQFVRAWTQKN